MRVGSKVNASDFTFPSTGSAEITELRHTVHIKRPATVIMLFTGTVRNITPTAMLVPMGLGVDGAQDPNSKREFVIETGWRVSFTLMKEVDVEPGDHTFSVWANGTVTIGAVMGAYGGNLMIIVLHRVEPGPLDASLEYLTP